MTKKDYVSFARMIRSQRHKIIQGTKELPSDKQFFNGADKQLSIIIDELVTMFQSDNSQFNADKFIKACQITE